MRKPMLGMLCCMLTFLPFTDAIADEGGAQKAVLVTGASTGIGRNLAETLAAEGYFVYAKDRITVMLASN